MITPGGSPGHGSQWTPAGSNGHRIHHVGCPKCEFKIDLDCGNTPRVARAAMDVHIQQDHPEHWVFIQHVTDMSKGR